ncbi:adenylate/guanylate cyclase domain-containing protein [Rhodoferax aquaticus]|uniref:Adenylate/guanylate cyclase domain-containing protein n=2 Tax=Rhodoferax aquaticus TaxID=2527691 RepID=A0A515EVK9_9BURK|nr:adenylate/guanylate cyclase domain-containing protein [Rhodoferax aquaticus]
MVWLLEPLALQSLRLAQFDQFQRWYPRSQTSALVRVIDIDEASLKAYGQWPWPRTRLVGLIEKLQRAGVQVIGFDVLLAEPDRTSPLAMAQLWGRPETTALLSSLPDHDTLLAESLRQASVVLGASLSRSGQGFPVEMPRPVLPFSIVNTGNAPGQIDFLGYDEGVWPLPALAAAASGLGALNFSADGDGVVRRIPLLTRLNAAVVPSLTAEMLRVSMGQRNYLLRSQDAALQELRIGEQRIPSSESGEMWLHYAPEVAAHTVSAAQVLQGRLPEGALKGTLVVVGSSAAGLLDLRVNPMGALMPGVQAHAQALDQLLLGYDLQRPGWATAAEALFLFVGALAAGVVALKSTARRATVFALGLWALLALAAWGAFVHGHLLLDVVNPALAIALSFSVGSAVHHFVSEREQRWLRKAFSRYVSPNRVAHLVAHPEQLHLGGQRQICSFIFTDLVDFTRMMEQGEPTQAVSLLNAYLDGMLAIVFKHEGTLDRIVGDAIAVLFSAPLPQLDHRRRALDCALEMDRFATHYAAQLHAKGLAWGATRIGVHCGEVIVGNFGGTTLFDYRALGDPVNTAARLESVNKHLGTRVCVSQALLDGCGAVPVRLVGQLVLKGKSVPLSVCEPWATVELNQCAPLAAYAQAMASLQTGADYNLEQARSQFAALHMAYPEDALVALHHHRLLQGAVDDVIVLAAK